MVVGPQVSRGGVVPSDKGSGCRHGCVAPVVKSESLTGVEGVGPLAACWSSPRGHQNDPGAGVWGNMQGRQLGTRRMLLASSAHHPYKMSGFRKQAICTQAAGGALS